MSQLHRQHRPVLATFLAISLTAALALAQQARGGGAQGVVQQPPALNGPAISARDRVYTADQTSNTVTVINPATNAVVGQIPLGNPRPRVLGALDDMQVNVHGLGFSPDGRYLDVISNASNGVTIIRTRDNQVMGTVYIGRGPHEGFFTPDGQQVWVTVRGEDYLSYGFRLFRVEIGTAPISTLHARNPFFSFSFCSDFQVFSTPFNRSPYQSSM
ncbi:hypothetical protein DESA109040_13165 [Deinococcus saxicola]|uniref:YncE family protein n=1 Tax=Deinococcus saxicola TaxID=249406 RepID=UPI0039EE90E1